MYGVPTCLLAYTPSLHKCCYSICSVVDGGWSSWRLGPCSKTCGGGTQTLTRSCSNPTPSCGGKECKGPSSNSKTCSDFCCPGKIIIK